MVRINDVFNLCPVIGGHLPAVSSSSSVRDQGAVREESQGTNRTGMDHQIYLPASHDAEGYSQARPGGGAYGGAFQINSCTYSISGLHVVIYCSTEIVRINQKFCMEALNELAGTERVAARAFRYHWKS